MINLTVDEERLERTVERARERAIIIPTFAQLQDPSLVPDQIKEGLQDVGLWELDSLNLFRITWKNEPREHGGGFNRVNTLELTPSLTGVPVRIISLIGKWFPTGSHKVGATFADLVPRLVTGQFDPTRQKAIWPSTGNYCRGGAYNGSLLACESIAILPEGMSQERFDWLSQVAGEVIKTPGTESNVKEIFDKTQELREAREDVVVFNQFEEFGNHLWHYYVTGHTMEEVLKRELRSGQAYRGVALASGSAGTLGCGDYLKERFPTSKIAASEPVQCPTLLRNGYGADRFSTHRIEGVGDRMVPWIHNVRNTDMVIGIDDEACISLLRLFNEPAGRSYLLQRGVPEGLVADLGLLGLSSIANVLSCIKLAKWYEMGEEDVLLTVFTDSADLYKSRLQDLCEERGEYTERDAAMHYARYLLGTTTDHVEELGYWQRKRIHNLKYFTWVEQQGKEHQALNTQWYDRRYWDAIHNQVDDIDALIETFNERTGLLKPS